LERVESSGRGSVSVDPGLIERTRGAIDRFLDLVENGAGDAAEAETELAVSLDELAACVSRLPRLKDMPECSSVTWGEAGYHAYRALRLTASERFPSLGLYGMPDVWKPGRDEEPTVGDAIDDIADIALDLLRVRRGWDEVGETAALWELRFSFESHWEAHLRGLQLYLFQRRYPHYIDDW